MNFCQFDFVFEEKQRQIGKHPAFGNNIVQFIYFLIAAALGLFVAHGPSLIKRKCCICLMVFFVTLLRNEASC